MSLFRKLINSIRPESASNAIDRELAFHIDQRIDELTAQGMPRGDAERAARKQFGNPTSQRENTRDADVIAWVDSLAGDVRYGLRALRRSPVFTTVAILSLALGIGANTSIYSLIDAVVLRPLPVPHPEQLVRLGGSESDNGGVFTNPLWEAIRDQQTGMTQVAAFSGDRIVIGEGGQERKVSAMLVGGDYFALFGMQPLLGRFFTRADDRRGCAPMAVISEGFWQSEFGGRADIIGKTVTLASEPFQIIAVMRPGFVSPDVGRETQVIAPICSKEITQNKGILDARSSWWLRIIGRRDSALSMAQLDARLASLAPSVYAATLPPDWGARFKQDYLTRTVVAIPAASGVSDVRRQYSKALVVMLGAVGLVLLIACANVANLLLARAAARQREVAIRLAIGASRRRLVRQLVTESTILAMLGAVLGLLVARWGTLALVSLISRPDSPLMLDTSLNVRVLLFTALLATVTVTLFGLVPAWRGTRISPQAAMKAGGRGVAEGHARFTLSKSLVVAQVALSLTLLVGSALLIGSLRNLTILNPGFEPQGVLIANASFRHAGMPEARLETVGKELLDRVRRVPGVTSAATADVTPISCCTWNDEVIADGFTPKNDEDGISWMNRVSDGYFRTLDTRMLAGRDFDATDVIGGPTSVIVNELFAKKFFHVATPQAALGRQFRTRAGDKLSDPYTVVGVVDNAKYWSLRETNSETAYFAASQEKGRAGATLVIRTNGSPLQLVPTITTQLADMQRTATASYTALAAQVAGSLQRERLLAILSGLFGAVALALATLGLYGVMSYTVARRRNEIGVRIALGADRSRVLGMVLGDVARVVIIGLAIGVAGAIASGKLVTSFLYGMTPDDPKVLGLAAVTLMLVALAAGLAPALKASRVDPVAALRED